MCASVCVCFAGLEIEVRVLNMMNRYYVTELYI